MSPRAARGFLSLLRHINSDLGTMVFRGAITILGFICTFAVFHLKAAGNDFISSAPVVLAIQKSADDAVTTANKAAELALADNAKQNGDFTSMLEKLDVSLKNQAAFAADLEQVKLGQVSLVATVNSIDRRTVRLEAKQDAVK
jgi:hypothetical protein